jgi:hypothetical protein
VSRPPSEAGAFLRKSRHLNLQPTESRFIRGVVRF